MKVIKPKIEIKVASIQELMLNGFPKDKAISLCDALYNMTDFICDDYPKYKSWFYKKHLPATLTEHSGRDVIFAYDHNEKLYGTSFIKQDEIEKKICTLFVSPESRGLGVTTALVEKSMQILGTTKPMITLADYKLKMFEGLIKKYNWEQTQIVTGLYNDHSKELVYNGFLEK